jgi:molybdate/tungstate transport system ATP-binding protein
MISVQDLVVQAGAFRLEKISFEVPNNEYGVLMGRTGCGKTTALEAICGLKKVSSGRIQINGRDITPLKPAARGIGYVPQDGALFTTMTVREHIAFPLIIRKWPADEIEQRVLELADLLGLKELLERKPQGLSGGEKQRVALGRALANHPDTLCLDEPLSALDEDTRDEMYVLLQMVQKRTGVTTLHITHSLKEAENLADRIYVFENGKVMRKR